MLHGLDQVYYWRYNGENVLIYLNIDVGLFGSHSQVIIKMQKVDPRAEGGVRILIKESDRDVSSLEKNSTFIRHVINNREVSVRLMRGS